MNESRQKWDLFVSGDKEAYGWLYTHYLQTLYNYGFKFTQDPELIKDSIQEVFTYLYKKRSSLEKPVNVRVYLMVCMKNRLLDMLRKSELFDKIEENAYLFDKEKSVEDDFIVKEDFFLKEHKINYLFSFLTDRQREILYYRFIQEMEIPDICQLMDLNYQSALNLIQRALKKIRDMYLPTLLLIALSSGFRFLL